MTWQRTAREWAEYTKALSWDELVKVADAVQNTPLGRAKNEVENFIEVLEVMNCLQLAADTIQQQEPEDAETSDR